MWMTLVKTYRDLYKNRAITDSYLQEEQAREAVMGNNRK
jgi:hypothetical protein